MTRITFLFLLIPAFLFFSCDQPVEKPASANTETPTASSSATALPSGTFKTNPEDGQIAWKAEKRFVNWGHTGTLKVGSGVTIFENGNLAGAEFVLDMNSIHCTDIDEGTDDYNKFIGHLKSPDFFSVDSFPVGQFVLISSQPGDDGQTFAITGKLTLKGITEEISFPATIQTEGNKFTMRADLTIDRSKWNVRYGSDTFLPDLVKDKIIKNEIELSLNISGEKAGA